jgi:hypothetical protein
VVAAGRHAWRGGFHRRCPATVARTREPPSLPWRPASLPDPPLLSLRPSRPLVDPYWRYIGRRLPDLANAGWRGGRARELERGGRDEEREQERAWLDPLLPTLAPRALSLHHATTSIQRLPSAPGSHLSLPFPNPHVRTPNQKKGNLFLCTPFFAQTREKKPQWLSA